MPRARKTWAEKMKTKPPHHVILDKDFAGIPTGSKLHISCPLEVAEELKSITRRLIHFDAPCSDELTSHGRYKRRCIKRCSRKGRSVVPHDTTESGFVVALSKDVCRSNGCKQMLIYVLPFGVDIVKREV